MIGKRKRNRIARSVRARSARIDRLNRRAHDEASQLDEHRQALRPLGHSVASYFVVSVLCASASAVLGVAYGQTTSPWLTGLVLLFGLGSLLALWVAVERIGERRDGKARMQRVAQALDATERDLAVERERLRSKGW